MRHERQLCVENEAQEFGFLNDFHGIPIKGQLWFCMPSAQLAKVHADSLGLRKLEPILRNRWIYMLHLQRNVRYLLGSEKSSQPKLMLFDVPRHCKIHVDAFANCANKGTDDQQPIELSLHSDLPYFHTIQRCALWFPTAVNGFITEKPGLIGVLLHVWALIVLNSSTVKHYLVICYQPHNHILAVSTMLVLADRKCWWTCYNGLFHPWLVATPRPAGYRRPSWAATSHFYSNLGGINQRNTQCLKQLWRNLTFLQGGYNVLSEFSVTTRHCLSLITIVFKETCRIKHASQHTAMYHVFILTAVFRVKLLRVLVSLKRYARYANEYISYMYIYLSMHIYT